FTYGTKIWIDFNKDGDFVDAGEQVYYGLSTNSNPVTLSGTFTVPGTVPTGVTRMRIGGTDTDAGGTPCYTSTYGTYEDYTVNIVTPPACSGAPVAGTASASGTDFCSSGSATLTLTGFTTGVTGISIQWYNTVSGAISGATSATYTTPIVTTNSSYFARVTCANGGGFTDSNTVNLTIQNPAIASTTPGTRCGTGSVSLTATGSSGTVVNWFASANGGSPLFTGTNFMTPNIAATTTYYASAFTGTSYGVAGMTGPAVTTNGTSVGSHGVAITTTQANLRISSIDIPFTGTGTFTVALKNSTNTTVISSFTSGSVTGAGLNPVTVPMNITVPAAGSYLLIVTAVTGTVNNLAYSTGTYPSSTLGGALTVTGGYWFGASTTNMYLYGITVSDGCSSTRTAVTASVTAPPALALSSSAATICEGSTTNAVTVTSSIADYDTYVWSPATGVSGTAATGYTFNPSATTVYTLTGSQSGGSRCANTATFTVTVNQRPVAITVTPASAVVCVTDPATALTVSPATANVSIGAGTAVNSATGTTDAYPSPYGAYYENAKQQYLILASELVQAGLQPGAINSLSFNVVTLGTSGIHKQYTVSLGSTSVSSLTTFVTGLNTVFGPVDYQPVAGNNVHAFSTPFIWDGTSNVVVQICHTNDDFSGGINYTNNAIVNYSVTPFNSSLTYYVDDLGACSSTTVSLTETQRPNLKLNGVANGVVWTPATGLYTNASATTPYVAGSLATVVYAKPTTSTVYTGTLSNASGCSRTVTSSITVNQQYPFFADADGDNFGTGTAVMICAAAASPAPAGYAVVGGDCNDNLAAVNPGKPEILYNGVDDNCDGNLDENNQLLSQVITQQCGITLAAINSVIGVNSFANTTQYRYQIYKVVGGVITGQPQYVERAQPYFTFTNMAVYEYATTYSIRVELQRNGVWLGYYGPACQVATPALLDNPNGSGSINASLCNTSLPTIATLIATPSLQSVTGYRFRITNQTNPLVNGQVQEIERAQNWFSLTMLPYYFYGTTYSVEVAVKTNGVFSGYGAACIISSPAVPMINNCDQHIAQPVNYISTASLNKVTAHRFEVSLVDAFDNPVSTQLVDRT
ncbi:MAG: hypothetical protein EOP51_20430, partial [Sphingobacteriales bacterium]